MRLAARVTSLPALYLPLCLVLFGALLPAALSTPSLADSPVYQISGTVINSSTDSPVPRCRLILIHVDQRASAPRRIFASQQLSAQTDEHGRFTLSVPSAGSWALRASAPGFRPQTLDQHENFSSSIVLTEKLPTYNLVFRIVPDSTITGTILDEGSEPVRQAQITVYPAPRLALSGASNNIHATGITDDRGRYEISGLAPGDYRLSIQAHPWYATAAQTFRSRRSSGPLLDPSLDVVYPITWFPGVIDADTAGLLSVQEGETRQADVQLKPMASTHLLVPLEPPSASGPDGSRGPMRYPQVQRISPGGSAFLNVSGESGGQLDFGGLIPGLYRVQTPDASGQPGRSTIIEVKAGSSQILDLASAANTATVTLNVVGDPGTETLPIVFVDANDASKIFPAGPEGEGMQPRRMRPQSQRSAAAISSPRTIDLPPAQYVVFQGGSTRFFVSGLTLGKNDIVGRLVTIPYGQSSLTLHIATGRANVTGIAQLRGKPVIGAMVLLVPITVDQPGSITETVRDQTNTDGSFSLISIIPGQYILVALDHGWGVNWNDPSTLVHYLSNGVPLDLRTVPSLRQNIDAQLP